VQSSSTDIVSRDNMAVKQNYVLVFVGFVFGSEAILKNDSGD
jgi:hypothetical protein